MTTPLKTDPGPLANIEAERRLIGSCLIDPTVIPACAELVAAEDFSVKGHRLIWIAITSLSGLGCTVDALTVADHLIHWRKFGEAGGHDAVVAACESVPHAANAEYYARIIREKAMERRLVEACTNILRMAYSGECTGDELLGYAQRAIGTAGLRPEAF